MFKKQYDPTRSEVVENVTVLLLLCKCKSIPMHSR